MPTTTNGSEPREARKPERIPHLPAPELPERWLVTGGCGFIGSTLVHRLLSLGVPSIRVVDHLGKGSELSLPAGRWRHAHLPDVQPVWPAGIELVRVAVEERAALRRCAAGADVVVHLAGSSDPLASLEDPFQSLEVEVAGTLSVLDAARLAGVGRVVLASSAELMSEVGDAQPSTPQAAGKIAGEAYALAYHRAFGLETVALRFGRVYGPARGAERTVVGTCMKAWIEGHLPELGAPDAAAPDFIHLDDVVDGLVRAATAPGIGGRVIPLAHRPGTSLDALLESLRGVARRFDIEPVRRNGVRASRPRPTLDPTLARDLIGWEPATPLERGLEETVRWLLAERKRHAASAAGRSVA